MTQVIISGCAGKMGRAVAEIAQTLPGVQVVAGVDLYAHEGSFSFPVFTDFASCDVRGDVVIDFSRPELLQDLLAYGAQQHTALVICTTGFTDEQLESISQHAEQYPVFRTANLSLGVNLMTELLKKAAAFLGEEYEVEIIEKHHNQKVDAPSGTAYMLADAVNYARNGELDYVCGRESRTQKRTHNELGIHAIRGGNIVGDHDVLFIGGEEILTISHHAQTRSVFARGALRAAVFIAHKKCGLYSMADLLAECKF